LLRLSLLAWRLISKMELSLERMAAHCWYATSQTALLIPPLASVGSWILQQFPAQPTRLIQ